MFDISAKRGGVSIKTNIVAHTFDDNFNNIMPDKSEVPLFHKLLRFQTCVEKYFFNVTFRVRKYQFCFKVTKIFGSIFIPGMRKKQKHLTRDVLFLFIFGKSIIFFTCSPLSLVTLLLFRVTTLLILSCFINALYRLCASEV